MISELFLIKLADRLHNMRTLGYMPEAETEAYSEGNTWISLPRLQIAWASGR